MNTEQLTHYKAVLKSLGFDASVTDDDLKSKLTGIGQLLLITNSNFSSWIESLSQANIILNEKPEKATLSDPITLWLILSNLYVVSEELDQIVNSKMAWNFAPPLAAPTVRRKLQLAISNKLVEVLPGIDKRSDRIVLTERAKLLILQQCKVWADKFEPVFNMARDELTLKLK